MNGTIKILEAEIDILEASLYDFDDSDLSQALFQKSKNILVEKTLGMIEKLPAFKVFLESLNVQQVFDVNMTKTARELYEKGELVLNYSDSKEGLIPILSNLKGKFVEQVTLNPRDVTPELSSALNNLAIQSQLGQLMDQMKIMNNSVQRIEIGQRDDRLGLYLSARQQFIESISMQDKSLQSYALLNSVIVANNAKFQLMQTMKSDIEQIISNKSLKKKERDSLLINIKSSMKYVNESTGLCMLIYSSLGEEKPLLASLKSYQCFLEQTLLKKDVDGLLISEKLHQNWSGHNDEWLEMPNKIVDNLKEIISIKTTNPIYVEGEKHE